MNTKSSTFISGVVAVGIYFFVIGLLLFYFNMKETQKPVHYVKKNEQRIRVSLGGPKSKVKKKTSVTQKEAPKKKRIKKKKPKETVKKQKDTRKKVIVEKIVKKVTPPKKVKKVLKKSPPKKVNKPKDLFASVSTKKRVKKKEKPVKKSVPIKEKPKSASQLFSESLKEQKTSDSGIENDYLAAIEEKLKGWPAQSEYAGERVKVWLKIETDGHFLFEVRSASANENFNTELIAYLEQLQSLGFGPHKGTRAYTVDVEFIAKE